MFILNKSGLSHSPQFINECIYLSLLSYSGTSVSFQIKFANEDGYFAPRRQEKKFEDLTRARKALAEIVKGMSKLAKIYINSEDEGPKDDIIKSNIKRVSFWKDKIPSQRDELSARRNIHYGDSFDFDNHQNINVWIIIFISFIREIHMKVG